MALTQKYIIDCDTGVDDAVALLFALQENIDLLAITCVNGNCSVGQAVHNTLVTLGIAGKQIPVYRGCSKPLSVVNDSGDIIHASDGLSGASNEYPCHGSCQTKHAVNLLLELINKYPGEITLICLGPLTNLAVAYRMEEDVSKKLKRLIVMGGNVEGKGNKRLGAEFNFLIDPQAAQIVVEETLCDMQICSWEPCGLNNCLPFSWLDDMLRDPKSEKGKFIKRIVTPFVAVRRKRWPTLGFALCDPFAVAVALFPDIVKKSVHQRVTVETAGIHSLGMMVAEWKEGLFPRNTKPAELILEIDLEKYRLLLEKLME